MDWSLLYNCNQKKQNELTFKNTNMFNENFEVAKQGFADQMRKWEESMQTTLGEFEEKLKESNNDVTETKKRQEYANEQCNRVEVKLEFTIKRIDKLLNTTSSLAEEKLNKSIYDEDIQRIRNALKNTQLTSERANNSTLKLENHIEKYLPVKIQQMISSCLECVLPTQSKRLKDYDEEVHVQLNEIIANDNGVGNISNFTKILIVPRKESAIKADKEKEKEREPEITQQHVKDTIENTGNKVADQQNKNTENTMVTQEFSEIREKKLHAIIKAQIELTESKLNTLLTEMEHRVCTSIGKVITMLRKTENNFNIALQSCHTEIEQQDKKRRRDRADSAILHEKCMRSIEAVDEKIHHSTSVAYNISHVFNKIVEDLQIFHLIQVFEAKYFYHQLSYTYSKKERNSTARCE